MEIKKPFDNNVQSQDDIKIEDLTNSVENSVASILPVIKRENGDTLQALIRASHSIAIKMVQMLMASLAANPSSRTIFICVVL